MHPKIDHWMVNTLKPVSQEWHWGRELFWLSFVAAFPEFPCGNNWPPWNTRVPLEGAFIESWVVARCGGGTSETDDDDDSDDSGDLMNTFDISDDSIEGSRDEDSQDTGVGPGRIGVSELVPDALYADIWKQFKQILTLYFLIEANNIVA